MKLNQQIAAKGYFTKKTHTYCRVSNIDSQKQNKKP